MREGEAFIRMSVPSGGSSTGGMMSLPRMELPGSETTREARLRWREKTGEKTGWIIKSDEEKTYSIKGRRCLECGYIDFYIKE